MNHHRIIQQQDAIKKQVHEVHVKAITGMHSVIPHVQLDVRTHNVIKYQVIENHVMMVTGAHNVNPHVHQDVKLQHVMTSSGNFTECATGKTGSECSKDCPSKCKVTAYKNCYINEHITFT